MTTPDRRQTILDAALAEFLARGYAATTIGDIRRRSGASTGSIYHFFAGKGAIAQALLQTAIEGWSGASSQALDETLPAREQIEASVRGLLTWGHANAALLRFLDEIRTLAAADPDFADVQAALASGQAAGAARYAAYIERGEVRPLPWPVAHSLMLGPAYNYLRLAPSPEPDGIATIADLFAQAAWQSVRAL